MKYYIDKWEELPRDVLKEYENLADSLFISPMFVASIYESGQFGFYEIDDNTTLPVLFQFEVIEDYSMCTKDAWEVLKETKIRVTDVKILEKGENAYEYYIQAA